MNIKVVEGVSITSVRMMGRKRLRVFFKGVPFSVSDSEVLELCRCLGTVGHKGIRYSTGDENLITMDRYADIELKRSMHIPPKILLGGRPVRVSYAGQISS